MKLLENRLNNQPRSCWQMLSFEWRYMTIGRRANVTIFQYMTLWLLFIASILNILSSHYTLLKSFLYAAHYKNNKTLSNSGRKHSRSKSHNKERCQTCGGGTPAFMGNATVVHQRSQRQEWVMAVKTLTIWCGEINGHCEVDLSPERDEWWKGSC